MTPPDFFVTVRYGSGDPTLSAVATNNSAVLPLGSLLVLTTADPRVFRVSFASPVDRGVAAVTLQAEDDRGVVATRAFVLRVQALPVLASNPAPRVTTIGFRSANTTVSAKFGTGALQLAATFSDNTAVVRTGDVRVTVLPGGPSSGNPRSFAVSVLPLLAAGSAQVTLQLSDAVGGYIDYQLDVTVNAPPLITPPATVFTTVNIAALALPVAVADGSLPVSLAISSNNSAVLDANDPQQVLLGGSYPLWNLDVKPRAAGVVAVRLDAADERGAKHSATFIVHCNGETVLRFCASGLRSLNESLTFCCAVLPAIAAIPAKATTIGIALANFSIALSGGTGARTVTVFSTAAGLPLSAVRVLPAEPSPSANARLVAVGAVGAAAAAATVTLQITDSVGGTSQRTYGLNPSFLRPPLAFAARLH